MLMTRATTLQNADFDKQVKVEKNIDEYVQKNYENIITPTRAFIVFEYDVTRDIVDGSTITF